MVDAICFVGYNDKYGLDNGLNIILYAALGRLDNCTMHESDFTLR